MGAKGKGKVPPPPQIGKGNGRAASYQEQKRTWIDVCVKRALTGEDFCFPTSSDQCIASLKVRLERHWNVPVLCQKIITDAGIVCQDADRIRKYCPNELSMVQLVMLVSDIEAQLYSKSDDKSCRYEAVVVFSQLAAHNSEALDSLLGFLDDPDHSVKWEAASGLANIARNGVERAIYALGGCMGFAFQDDLNKLTAATEALAYLLSENNNVAWTVVLDCLDNPDGEVAREAVKVLAVASLFYNNERALSLLSKCMEHPKAYMRQYGVTGIGFVACVGDARAIDGLVGRLEDESVEVRNSAVAGLGSITVVGDERITSILLSLLKEPGDSLNVVLVALSKIAHRGDKDVLSAVQRVVEDPKGPHFALSTYAKLARHGDEQVIRTLLSRAQDANREVRAVAVVAISRLASDDDRRLIPLLTSAAQDSDIEVRITAVHALSFVAMRGDQEAFTILSNLEDDPAHRVRSTAERFVIYLQSLRSGDSSASRALQHAFKRIWRQWSVDFAPEEREHVNDARRG